MYCLGTVFLGFDYMAHLLKFIKKNTVFCIAGVAAIITCFLVPPDIQYLEYFDFKTLVCLFITLAVVCALRNIWFFTIIARKLVRFSGNLRGLFLMLIFITFLGSMLIANDMALITFLPLGYFALTVAKQEKYMAYLFVLQNISANLGGMLTPFGNPQNLYLYSYYNIPAFEFCKIMFLPFLLAVFLLVISVFAVKPIKISITENFGEKLKIRKTVIYLLLFCITLLVVFRIVPILIGFAVVTAVIFIFDREALLSVDYYLLGTFFFFFIFAGNLARIDEVNRFFSFLIQKDSFLVPVFSCQLISNVPTAILLSHFTTNYKALLLGVNIGGTGTLISSLASLITFSEYGVLYPNKKKLYFGVFTLMNVVFLVIMSVAAKLFFV